MRKIGGPLGRSPFGPIHEQMTKVCECVKMLPELIEAFASGDDNRGHKAILTIDKLEGEADDVKAEMRSQLSASFFGSTERADMLFLVNRIDAIADECQEVAKLIDLRETRVEEDLAPDLKALTSKVVETACTLTRATEMFKRILESSFARREVAKVVELMERVNREEFEADVLEKGALKRLFSLEEKLDPTTVFLLMRIIQSVGHIADQAENASDSIRLMVEKR